MKETTGIWKKRRTSQTQKINTINSIPGLKFQPAEATAGVHQSCNWWSDTHLGLCASQTLSVAGSLLQRSNVSVFCKGMQENKTYVLQNAKNFKHRSQGRNNKPNPNSKKERQGLKSDFYTKPVITCQYNFIAVKMISFCVCVFFFF